MEKTPRGSRLHIALFGRRNAGKSSLINAITSQDIALVSTVPGTTTDPVYKAMEVIPLGPVMLIDTAGIDDEGELGDKRVQRTLKVLQQTDVALLVVDAYQGLSHFEREIAKLCEEKEIPFLVVFNKEDLLDEKGKNQLLQGYQKEFSAPFLWASAWSKKGIPEVLEYLSHIKPTDWLAPAIVGDLVPPGEMIVLVTPIDQSAPKGRLILPQVQTIRDILDHECLCVVCKENELKRVLENFKKPPALVVTDSQVFQKVNAETPPEIALTSFSILMARYKGDLPVLVEGAQAVEQLKSGDRVLISEACTHNCQSDDIGRVKIPNWLKQKVGEGLQIDYAHGYRFPADLEKYKLVIHCGGCMLNRREMLYRINEVKAQKIPIVNYGVFIAYIHGILPRVLAPFEKKVINSEDS